MHALLFLKLVAHRDLLLENLNLFSKFDLLVLIFEVVCVESLGRKDWSISVKMTTDDTLAR